MLKDQSLEQVTRNFLSATVGRNTSKNCNQCLDIMSDAMICCVIEFFRIEQLLQNRFHYRPGSCGR